MKSSKKWFWWEKHETICLIILNFLATQTFCMLININSLTLATSLNKTNQTLQNYLFTFVKDYT